MYKSALVEMWGCSAGKHVPHTAQACNLLLGTVQAACLTAQSHLLLGSPLGALYWLEIFHLICRVIEWLQKVMLSSLKNMRTVLHCGYQCHSGFHIFKLGASHSVMRQVRINGVWNEMTIWQLSFSWKSHLCKN